MGLASTRRELSNMLCDIDLLQSKLVPRTHGKCHTGNFHFFQLYARHEVVAQLKMKQETEIDWLSHGQSEGAGLVQIRRVHAR
jgi:hypothetical protein